MKRGDGEAFIKWLTSPAGQAAIGAYRIDGAQAFFPTPARRGLEAGQSTGASGAL